MARLAVGGIVGALVLALALPSASAKPSKADRERALEYYAVGAEAMKKKAYKEAAVAFDLAYDLDPNPTLLWNVARAHELAGNLRKAQRRYQEYLKTKRIPKKLRIEARARLVKIKVKLQSTEHVPDKPPDPPVEKTPEEPPAVKTPDPPPDKPPEASSVSKPPAQPEVVRTTGPSVAVWISVGAGAALVGTGLALHFVAENDRSSVIDPAAGGGIVRTVTQKQAQAIEDDANALDSAGLATIIIGGAAIVTGVVLLFTTGGQTVVTPTVGPTDVSIVARGSF